MSLNYIELGTTCEPFSQPTVPGDITALYLSSATGILNPRSRVTSDTTGSYTEIANNSFLNIASADYAFQLRSTVTTLQRFLNTKKLLQPNGASTGTFENSIFESTYTPSSVTLNNGNSYTVNVNDSILKNLILNTYRFVSSYTIQPNSNPPDFRPTFANSQAITSLPTDTYWLRKVDVEPSTSTTVSITTKQYLKYNGPGNTEILDMYKVDVNASDLGPSKDSVKFQLRIDTTTTPVGYALKLYVYNNPSYVNVNDSDYSIIYDPSKTPNLYIKVGSNFFIFDGEAPQDEATSTRKILLRDTSSPPKYLFMNGITPSLENYWSAPGISGPQDLATKTVFSWLDLTPLVSGNNQDIYHWMVGTNYLKYDANSILRSDSTVPPRDEGWVLAYAPSASSGSIQYVRKNTVISNVYVNDSGTLIFPSPASNTNPSSPIFKCVNCTNPNADGLCNP